jgi:hypothetical protein
MALTQADPHGALVYVGAAQGGLILFAAAVGIQPAVWLALLALTLPRLLLFLATDVARCAGSCTQRRIVAAAFALGGLAWTAFGLLATWWARESGAPLDALPVAEAAVGLGAVWVAGATHRLLVGPGEDLPPTVASPVQWAQWVAISVLGGSVLAGTLGFGPLASRLLAASGMRSLQTPALPALLRYAVTAPALLAVMVSVLVVLYLQRRSRAGPIVATMPAEEMYDLEEGLARAARVLHAVVEVGILERLVVLTVRGVVQGARVTYRVVEQEGLEGLLRRSVRAVLALSRGLQSAHTGRLRHSLLWVTASLALAVLALVLYGG